MTVSYFLLIVVVAVQTTLCEEQFSICDYAELTFGSSSATVSRNPVTQVQDKIPVNSSVISFHSSEYLGSEGECYLHVSGSKIIQMNVMAFDLGGHEPCSPEEEHLSISFYRYYSDIHLVHGYPRSRVETNRGYMDTVLWCGQSYSTRLETRQKMVIRYFGGPESQRGSGFNLSFSSVDQFMCGRGVEQVGAHPMYIYSPGYPDVYDNGIGSSGQQCSWELTSQHGRHLLLETDRFALESHHSCNYDYLMVNRKKYCGDQKLRVTSQHNRFWITFFTDHTNQRDSFVLKVVEMAGSHSCGREIMASTSPTTLLLPELTPGHFHSVECWWLVDARGDDRVVFLENAHFSTSVSCTELELKIYDGQRAIGSPRILSRCAPLQMFRAVRSSGRYLYIVMDIQVNVVGANDIEGFYTVTSQLRDGVPRVLYAGFADSFIWLHLSPWNEVGLYVRGDEEDVGNYSTCLHLEVKESSNLVTTLNISDYFYVFSGHNSSFAELGTACGRTSSKVLISRGSKMYVVPRVPQNDTQHPRGLWLMYSLSRYCEPEAVRLQSSSSAVQLVQSDQAYTSTHPFSFSYSRAYPNNAYCKWLIVPESSSTFIQAKAKGMDLWNGDCYDNVTAYDDWTDSGRSFLWQWCGYNNDGATTSSKEGGPLLLSFVTNSRDSSRGFTISYSSVSLIDECPSMAALMAVKAGRNLTSPNYPSTYPNGVNCKWRIRAERGVIRLTVLYLSLFHDSSVCSLNDRLIIYDGQDSWARTLATICSSDTGVGVVTSSGPYVLVQFLSNDHGTSTGFSLQYQTAESEGFDNCNKAVFVTEAEDRIITSPYYPNAYTGYTDCYWAVEAPLTHVVMLEVDVLDLPCDSPVILYDGPTENSLKLVTLCGSSYQKRYVSTQKSMYIRFRSTSNRFSSSGFRFRLRSWKGSQACSGGVGHLMAFDSKRYVSSPGYPGSYPPFTTCRWRFESTDKNKTVRIEFEDVDRTTEPYSCQQNTVNIYDGYGMGSILMAQHVSGQSGTYWSSELYLFLNFESNSARLCNGFRLSYQSVSYRPPVTPAPDNSKGFNNNTITIAVAVIGVLVFLVMALTIFFCIYRRKLRRSAQNSSSQSHSTIPMRHRHHREREGSTVYVMNPVIVNQMAPPPYPGLSNGSYANEDLPPAYPAVAVSVPPPLHGDAPPSYAESMLETNPPAGAGTLTVAQGGGDNFLTDAGREPRLLSPEPGFPSLSSTAGSRADLDHSLSRDGDDDMSAGAVYDGRRDPETGVRSVPVSGQHHHSNWSSASSRSSAGLEMQPLTRYSTDRPPSSSSSPPRHRSPDPSYRQERSGAYAAQQLSEGRGSQPDRRSWNSAPPRKPSESVYRQSAPQQGEEPPLPQHRPEWGSTSYEQQPPPPPYQSPSPSPPPLLQEQQEPLHDSPPPPPPPPRTQHRGSLNTSPSPQPPAPESLPLGAAPSTQQGAPPGGQQDDEGSAGDVPPTQSIWRSLQAQTSTEV
ncbi:cubilin-like [Babylonia areolata]|uniref:cubilin-like n=1 Tax=Babylonia areolata TaxID=304850 RepID=UPI003FD08739